MKNQNSLKNFEQFALSKEEMENQKGGIFCEFYVAYAESQGIPVDPNVMSIAEQLDETLYSQGWWAALQQGAATFLSTYS